jgi:hypothetical protein
MNWTEPTERIMLYDSDTMRAQEISERLRDRGYICRAAKDRTSCEEGMRSGGYGYLFVGRTENNLGLFGLIREAEKWGIRVFHMDLADGGQAAVRSIENELIVSSHER